VGKFAKGGGKRKGKRLNYSQEKAREPKRKGKKETVENGTSVKGRNTPIWGNGAHLEVRGMFFPIGRQGKGKQNARGFGH